MATTVGLRPCSVTGLKSQIVSEHRRLDETEDRTLYEDLTHKPGDKTIATYLNAAPLHSMDREVKTHTGLSE